ncbi:MAG: hypothetical protein O3B31_02355, partial [Chloroflexi bacterium]|nr:hypothetical protein [Chloroflexota bacterium]
RDASTDSRDFGPVARARIEGVAVGRYWPPRRIGRIARPRRELAGLAPTDSGAPEGIVGAGRALMASPRRVPQAEPRADGAGVRPEADVPPGEKGGRSGEA